MPMTRTRPWLPAALGLALLASCDSEPGAISRPDELGPYGVGHRSFVARDASRDDRPLLLDLWYPVDARDWAADPRTGYTLMGIVELESEVAVEGLPVSARSGQSLVVFSHGYGGINTQSTDLMETLASHGFIVAAVEHTGNAQGSMTDDFDAAAKNRVPDVSFVIDTLLARSTDPGDPLYDRIDPARVGVVGHSFGGMTAVGMAAGWAEADPDPRVVAIAPISAVIDGELQADVRPSPYAGFSEAQLASVTVPVMLLGGTADEDVPIENNDLAFAQMTAAPVVYQVDIHGATHTHFANVCAIGNLLIELNLDPDSWPTIGASDLIEPYQNTCTPEAFPIEEAIRLESLYVVAFFLRHLRGIEAYDEYLSTAYADTEPAVTFRSRGE